jgi:predicted transcriptional regulator
MAREIKLNGRELMLLRTIGFGLGVSGSELAERMNMLPDELVDVINTLIDIGYVETASGREIVKEGEFATENFEITPGFATDLREAMKRR